MKLDQSRITKAMVLLAVLAAANTGASPTSGASNAGLATSANNWQQIYASQSNSLFSSLSQDSNGNTYGIYLANADNSSSYGNLNITKYNSASKTFQPLYSSSEEVSTPLSQFDSLNRLYVSYVNLDGSVSYARLSPNGGLSFVGQLAKNIVIPKNFAQAAQKLSTSLSLQDRLATVNPDWYGMNQYSFNINNDQIYSVANITTATGLVHVAAQVCDLNNLCTPQQDISSEPNQQSYFAELSFADDNSAYVVFNQAADLSTLKGMRGIMKEYNRSSKTWQPVCNALPLNGKVVSAPLIHNGTAYVIYSHFPNGSLVSDVMACDLSQPDSDWSSVSGNQNLTSGATWYPQIRLYNNTIVATFRQAADGGDCNSSQNCAIYVSALQNKHWTPLGPAASGQLSNATKISEGADADLENPSVQNGQLFISFLNETVSSSGQLWQAQVVSYDPQANNWVSVCGGPVANSKQSRKWGQGAGGFILATADQPSFLTYSQIIGDNFPPDPQSQSFTAAIASCGK